MDDHYKYKNEEDLLRNGTNYVHVANRHDNSRENLVGQLPTG